MTVPGNIVPLLMSEEAAATGYQVSRSLRFNGTADSSYLSRTPASAGNRTIYTWSFWIKRWGLGEYHVFRATSDASNYTEAYFSSNDKLNFQNVVSGAQNTRLVTTQVFRDASAWYHFVIAINGSTSAKIYVNGTEITAYDTTVGPGSSNHQVNNTVSHTLGSGASTSYANFYLAECHLIDGQALTPSSFAETDATTGQWIPKLYSGSYGTNGFKLTFADNSAATAAALGKDTSGNSNNWTPNNFSVSDATYFVDGVGSALDAYIPGGWTRTSDPFNCLVNNNVGVIVSQSASNYFAITATSSTVTVKWIVYDGSGTSNPTVSLSTSRWSGNVFPSSTSGDGSTGSPSVGTYAVNSGTTYYVRTGLTGNGNPALVVYVTGATIAPVGTSVTAAAGIDSLVDTPTSYGTDDSLGGSVRGNYCTLNPLDNGGTTLSNGNLDVTKAGAGFLSVRGTIGMSSGKWYWEYTRASGSGNNLVVGLAGASANITTYFDISANGYGYRANDGNKTNNNTASSYGASYAAGDVVGIAFDADAGSLTFYKNGTSQGTAFTSLTSGPYFPAVAIAGGDTGSLNFGQRAFAYPVSGFKALCDTNLPAPIVAKPSTVMDVKLYTGTAATQSITGLGFSPDFVWIKNRNGTAAHHVFDIVRGATKRLITNGTQDDSYNAYDSLTSFDTSGFTLGADTSTGCVNNPSGATYVAWAWDAGSSAASTNNSGSIQSTVKVNASAGFSIVSWSANNTANQSIGHGLGVTPAFIIHKNRTTAGNWNCWFTGFSNDEYINLNGTGAKASTGGGLWYQTPTSSLFYIGFTGSAINNSTDAIISYCFAPVAGYSSAFSYTGNGDSSGPFVHLGFRPRFIIQKRTDSAGSWLLIDTARDPVNVARNEMFANSSAAEYDNGSLLDVLSNGFKIRATFANMNASGGSYIGFAWAESPFQYARAR